MRINDLTPEQVQKYFEARLPGQAFTPSGKDLMARCPFHEDSKASLSLNFCMGVWNCHAGCGAGGLCDFEKKLSGCDDQTAVANIAEIVGLPQLHLAGAKPEAVYQYTDEAGRIVLEVLRYPGKRFSQRKPDSKGGYEYKLGEMRKPLYNLPGVITANHVVIVEGEKDADRLNSLKLDQHDQSGFTRLAATTNVGGAGKWKPEYSPYLTGKTVAILPDNDQLGEAHAKAVAASVFPCAHSVRIVRLPGLPPKGDVSDYQDTHTPEELLAEIKRAPLWNPGEPQLLIPAPKFDATVSEEIEWLVRGVIQCGANGFICSNPKTGKSWLGVDLALSLALGVPWVDFLVSRRTKVALVTREDNPALTKWRLRHVLRGKGKEMADLGDWLWVNSREQSPEFRLDRPDQLTEMVGELKRVKPEFLILDVFNVLHVADENDNTEMRGVLEQLNVIQREVGCSICVLHHFNKQAEGSLTLRLRGSSAIAGWAEFLIGIAKTGGDRDPRRMDFELKAALPPEPVCFKINSDDLGAGVRIERTDPPQSFGTGDSKGARRRPDDLLQ
jgi:hypothetical protein